MGDQTAKCFIKGEDGKFARATEWSKDEIMFAITLRTISKKAYELLRKKNVYPLPGLSTLRAKYADFQVTEGFLDSVSEILLKVKAKQLEGRNRVVGIQFDEAGPPECLGT